MLERFMHYGKEVLYQYLDKPFPKYLKENKIDYVELPIIDDFVVTYEYQGQKRYAYMPGSSMCKVYIIEDIPLDMSWENIDLDYMGQEQHEPPMQLKSRAATLIAEADRIISQEKAKSQSIEEFLSSAMPEPDYDGIKTYLMFHFGYRVDDIMEMQHDDVPEDVLEGLANAKYVIDEE